MFRQGSRRQPKPSCPSLLYGRKMWPENQAVTATKAEDKTMPETATLVPTGFDQLGLHETLLRGVQFAGFEQPRPIQLETIPPALEGRDVLGLAHTGTGKTAAFALPMLELLGRNRQPGPRALVLAPTRELATQIAEEMRTLARFQGLKVVTIFGGASMRNQINALKRKPQVIVGCPGRVLDLIRQGYLRLGKVETLVLDEADHMFDMGFLPDIRSILAELPEQRQNLLFSATMPSEVRGLADALLQDPHFVDMAGSAPVATIDHALFAVAEERKGDLLGRVLERADCKSAIVFTRTKHRARRLAEQLERGGRRAVALQGNMSQFQRDRAMRGFREGRFNVLVATDIAARGIDVAGVSYVVNFDVPMTPEAYTHRIGRTGRGESEGIACTFITHADRRWVRATEAMIGQEIPRRSVTGFDSGYQEQFSSYGAPRGQGGRNSFKPKGRNGRSNPGGRGFRGDREGGGGFGGGSPKGGDRNGSSQRNGSGGPSSSQRNGSSGPSGGGRNGSGGPKGGTNSGGRRGKSSGWAPAKGGRRATAKGSGQSSGQGRGRAR